MHFCGNCGNSLDPVTLVDGRCPNCGAPITPPGTPPPFGDSALAQNPPEAPTAPTWPLASSEPPPPPRGTWRPFLYGSIASILVALLVVLGVWGWQLFATSHNPPGGADLPFPAPTATANDEPTFTPRAIPTSTPRATATVNLPELRVTPLKVTLPLCTGTAAQVTVTVSNGGGGTLVWRASASQLSFQVTPNQGALKAGAQEKVTVGGIKASGTVTFRATGAAHSPQTVIIQCGL